MNYKKLCITLFFCASASVTMNHDGSRMVLKNGRVLDYRTGIEIGIVLPNGSFIHHYPDPLNAYRRQGIIERVAQHTCQNSSSVQKVHPPQEH